MTDFKGVEHYVGLVYSAPYRFPLLVRGGGTNAIAEAYAQDVMALVERIKELEEKPAPMTMPEFFDSPEFREKMKEYIQGIKKRAGPSASPRPFGITPITTNFNQFLNDVECLTPDIEALEAGEPSNIGWGDVADWLEKRIPDLETLIRIARRNADIEEQLAQE